ncbi:hypothetical protein QZH41_006866 [Actinostola sp. cb2023]|nr:hypothetical protein QZH41_006866 [Actinostola sp. cb2023]
MLSSVVSSDEGWYLCQANNLLGEAISNGSYVTVFSPPTFSISPVNQTVAMGTEVTLTCKVTGYPLPVIGWTKDGEDLGTGIAQARNITGNNTSSTPRVAVSATSSKFSFPGVAIGNSTITSHVTQPSAAHLTTNIAMVTVTPNATNDVIQPSTTVSLALNTVMTSSSTPLPPIALNTAMTSSSTPLTPIALNTAMTSSSTPLTHQSRVKYSHDVIKHAAVTNRVKYSHDVIKHAADTNRVKYSRDVIKHAADTNRVKYSHDVIKHAAVTK